MRRLPLLALTALFASALACTFDSFGGTEAADDLGDDASEVNTATTDDLETGDAASSGDGDPIGDGDGDTGDGDGDGDPSGDGDGDPSGDGDGDGDGDTGDGDGDPTGDGDGDPTGDGDGDPTGDGDGDTGDGDGDTGDGDGDTGDGDGDPGDGDGDPGDGYYGSCPNDVDEECMVDEYCHSQDDWWVCTSNCGGSSDCAEAPPGTNVQCIVTDWDFEKRCYLSCEGDSECPEGMTCKSVNFGADKICVYD